MQAYQYNHLHYKVQIICLTKIPLFFFKEKHTLILTWGGANYFCLASNEWI